MRCPKSRFPIRIIVFDELELILFVSQGLTLSTASLVINFFVIKEWTVWPQSNADKCDDDGSVSGLEFLPGDSPSAWMGFISSRGKRYNVNNSRKETSFNVALVSHLMSILLFEYLNIWIQYPLPSNTNV